MTRELTARFPGTCQRCNGPIREGERIVWTKGEGAVHFDLRRCDTETALASQRSEPVDVSRVISFLTEAKTRGLSNPVLRVVGPDGSSEVRLKLTKGGRVPGSVTVTYQGIYQGVIRPSGKPERVEREMLEHLRELAAQPATAAKEYATLNGRCSFCGFTLTDEGSIEVGYGPVCAKRWGLPHKAKSTHQPKAIGPSYAELGPAQRLTPSTRHFAGPFDHA